MTRCFGVRSKKLPSEDAQTRKVLLEELLVFEMHGFVVRERSPEFECLGSSSFVQVEGGPSSIEDHLSAPVIVWRCQTIARSTVELSCAGIMLHSHVNFDE